jgi:Kef-type K+ transport system membrane component KefB
MGSVATASVYQTEEILFRALLQLIVIILAARCANGLLRRIGQPGVVGEIVAGLLLGPSFLGYFFPGIVSFLFPAMAATPIMVISQIGLILLMFQIGSDFEFGHLRHARNRSSVIVIAAASILTPLVLGLAIGVVSAPVLAPGADVLAYSLFVGVALAITAVPVLGRILREFDLAHTTLGAITISAAAINDVVGWVLLAGVSAYTTAKFSARDSVIQLGGIIALTALLRFAGRLVVGWLLRCFPVVRTQVSPNLMALVLALVFGLGIYTYLLGIFTIFGGFAAGLLFHRHRTFVEAWRHQAGQFVLVFFLPVFFTYTGMRTNVLGLVSAEDWLWCSLLLVSAMLGKIAPVYLASRFVGFTSDASATIGVLMNTRGLMELIVLNIGFEQGFISQKVFTMLVIMAIATTFVTAPLLRILLRRIGHAIPMHVDA